MARRAKCANCYVCDKTKCPMDAPARPAAPSTPRLPTVPQTPATPPAQEQPHGTSDRPVPGH